MSRATPSTKTPFIAGTTIHRMSLMSLAATALVLIGVGLALRALVLLVPDREPGGETLPSRLRVINGGRKGPHR